MEKWRFIKVKRCNWTGHPSLGWVRQLRNLGQQNHPSSFSLGRAVTSLREEMREVSHAFNPDLSLQQRAFEFAGELLQLSLSRLENHRLPGGLEGMPDWKRWQKGVLTALHWCIICQYTGKTALPLHKMLKAFYTLLLFMICPLVLVLKTGWHKRQLRIFFLQPLGQFI